MPSTTSTNKAAPSPGAVSGPISWWLAALVALFVIAAGLLAIQFLGGNTGTAVYSGSPVAAPQTENPSVPVMSSAVQK